MGLENAEVTTTGAYGQGTIYNDYNRLGSMLQVTAWHITEFHPMSRQVHVSESVSLPSTMTLCLSPVLDTTCVTMSVEFSFMPRWGIVGRVLEQFVMRHVLKNVLRQNLTRLDKYLQAKSNEPQSIAETASQIADMV